MGIRLKAAKGPSGRLHLCRHGRSLRRCGCEGTPCPFYWRAEHCNLPGCFVYVCSDAKCKDGAPLKDGSVFLYQGQCYHVLTAVKYVPNPHDGSPPPDGFAFLPVGAVLDTDMVVECKPSCGDCPPGNCGPPDCVDRPQGYGAPCDTEDCGKGTVLSGCCDCSGRIAWSGSAEVVEISGDRRTWDWYGSLQGFPGGQTKAIEKFYLKRVYYPKFGNPHTDIFDFNGGYEVAVDAVCTFSGPQNALGTYGYTCPGKFDKGSCSYSHTLNAGSFSRFVDYGQNGSNRFSESWKRTPGVGKCGPSCPDGRPTPTTDTPGENTPSVPGQPGAGTGDCPRGCGGTIRPDGKCGTCSHCSGCGG